MLKSEKSISSGRDKFNKSKTLIRFSVSVFKLLPKGFRIFIWDSISSFSQILFIALRYVIFKSLVSECGANVRIGTNVRVLYWQNLKVGSNISIHDNCYIDAAGQISIADDVSIAHGSSILSTNHGWDDLTKPIKYNHVKYESVFIDNDVWIGCGCRILSGVKISSRAIIAAGAVVSRDCLSNSIYGGVPAKLIKSI